MKRFIMIATVLGLVAPAMAFLGMPIAEDAHSSANQMRVTGSLTFEDDVNLYGGRFTYGLTDDLSIFGGLGIADVDGADQEPYLQVGGKYTLPVDLPFDLALRGAFGITSFEESARNPWGRYKVEVDVWTLSAGLLASKAIDQMFTVYGFGGVSYQKWDVSSRVVATDAWGREQRQSFSDDDSETELALAGGAIFTLNHHLSFFGEISHIDELFVSLGARFEF